MIACPNQAETAADCPCTYAGCPRHGACCQCVKYHRGMDQLPACCFTPEEERTYDRSVTFFVASRTGRK